MKTGDPFEITVNVLILEGLVAKVIGFLSLADE